MWALGDYPAVAIDVIPELGPELVAASGVRAGDRVLDVAAGTGNAAVPAALTGARVVASDLTPELFVAGRAVRRPARRASWQWEEGDAEALPYDDGAFDVVLSCVGVMFAPHHQRAADELVRVCRPGGTIGLLSWTPRGLRRRAVPDDEAVRARRRRPVRSRRRCGATRTTSGRCSATGSPTSSPGGRR